MKKCIEVLIIAGVLLFFGTANAVVLEWDGPVTGAPYTGFNVYYQVEGDSNTLVMIEMNNVQPTALDIPNTNFLYQIEYEFWVKAKNSFGEGGPSNIVLWTRPVDDVPGACILRVPGL